MLKTEKRKLKQEEKKTRIKQSRKQLAECKHKQSKI